MSSLRKKAVRSRLPLQPVSFLCCKQHCSEQVRTPHRGHWYSGVASLQTVQDTDNTGNDVLFVMVGGWIVVVAGLEQNGNKHMCNGGLSLIGGKPSEGLMSLARFRSGQIPFSEHHRFSSRLD